MDKKVLSQKYDAWHPGIDSEIPTRLLPLVTLFRPENSDIDYAKAKEIGKLCGIDAAELVSFRAERLVVHELLIRVTADLSVPDGPSYEELGINLRSMAATILDKYIPAEIAQIRLAFGAIRSEAESFISAQLAQHIFSPVGKATHKTKKPLSLKKYSVDLPERQRSIPIHIPWPIHLSLTPY